MGNMSCADCISDEREQGRKSYLTDDIILDQLYRKSDAYRYAIIHPYSPKVDSESMEQQETDLNNPTTSEGYTMRYERNDQLMGERLNLSLSLSEIRQARESLPLSELKLIHYNDQTSKNHFQGDYLLASNEENNQYTYKIKDCIENDQENHYNDVNRIPPNKVWSKKSNSARQNQLTIPPRTYQSSNEKVQFGRANLPNYDLS